MGYAKTAEDVKKAFPNGALVAQDNRVAFEIVDLKVHEIEDEPPVLIGWAPPSKDIVIDLDNVLVRKRDWLVFSKGQKISLRPLTKAREAQVRDMMY